MNFFGVQELYQVVQFLGRLGTSVVAANSIAGVVRQMAMVVVFGLANTTAIMVGKEIGSHNYRALKNCKNFYFAFIFSLIGAAMIYFISPLL